MWWLLKTFPDRQEIFGVLTVSYWVIFVWETMLLAKQFFDSECIALSSLLLCCSPTKMLGYLEREAAFQCWDVICSAKIWSARESLVVCCWVSHETSCLEWVMWCEYELVLERCHQEPCAQILVVFCYATCMKVKTNNIIIQIMASIYNHCKNVITDHKWPP